MEDGGNSTNLYKKMKQYWRSKRRGIGYVRINNDHSSRGDRNRRDRHQAAFAGAGKARRRFFVKIKNRPKIKKIISYPKKLLVWLRDSYVNMMLRLANSPAAVTGGGFGGGGGFWRGPLKEYDEKMLVEIYKSVLLRQKQLLVQQQSSGGHHNYIVGCHKLDSIIE